MRILLYILLLCSCSSTKHGRGYFDSTIIKRDSVHITIKKDTLGYDSVRYHIQDIQVKATPKFFRYRYSLWAILIILAAILVKVYVK